MMLIDRDLGCVCNVSDCFFDYFEVQVQVPIDIQKNPNTSAQGCRMLPTAFQYPLYVTVLYKALRQF